MRVNMSRFVNGMLFALLAILGVSGLVMLYGDWLPWLFELHRITGFALAALAPWKGVIIFRSLRRGVQRTFDRSVVIFASLLVLGFILAIILLAVLWMWSLGPYSSLGQTLIAWHWILGLLVAPLLAFHAWRRWPRPRRSDFLSRRGAVQVLGLAGAGLVFGKLAVQLAEAQDAGVEPRRFTSSHGFGSFAGNGFPITGETPVELDPSRWRLLVGGRVRAPLELTYSDLVAQQSRTLTAVLDCTSGWYTVQDWQGIRLVDLLEQAGMVARPAGVRLVSATGYNHSFPMGEARRILLATHVTGQILEPRHGFPLRAVVPGRRGWFWVKCLEKIEVLASPWEVLAGVASSPRQVLRQWK
jgi:DMSO/TMAO reductase YedYZ molybdopterin-dependent catalytic subunit